MNTKNTINKMNLLTNKINLPSKSDFFQKIGFRMFQLMIVFFVIYCVFLIFSPNGNLDISKKSTPLIDFSQPVYPFICLFIFAALFAYGNMKLKKSFFEIFNKNLIFLILYVLSLIFLFAYVSSKTLNDYAIYFLTIKIVKNG